MIGLTDSPDGCLLSVRVHAGTKRDAVTGVHDGAVKIALQAPPVDGRANEALIAFLAEKLGLPRARLSLIAGAGSRSKVVRITGLGAAEVWARLGITAAG